MLAILKREIRSYFYSPIAYVLIGLFMLVTAIFFTLTSITYQVADFNGVLSNIEFILMIIIPMLTMRIMAEDRKSGTEVLLITSPTKITDIVLGKYLATFGVFLAMTVISFIFPIILYIFGKPYFAPLAGGYIGFVLIGAAYIAIGLFASALTENQIVAAIITFVALLIIRIIDPIAETLGGVAEIVLKWFSLTTRYEDFNRGILDLSSIVYYISFVAVFIFLTVRIIDKRRWSQG